jgi:hypothetical protein
LYLREDVAYGEKREKNKTGKGGKEGSVGLEKGKQQHIIHS